MEYAIGAVVGGFIVGLVQWHWRTAPQVHGSDRVSFPASSIIVPEPRQGVTTVLFGRVLDLAAKRGDRP
jgi:hypothetical protein